MEELSKKDILTLIGENLTTIRRPGYKGFDEGTELEEMPALSPDDRQFPKLKEPDPTKPNRRGGKIVLGFENGETLKYSQSTSIKKFDDDKEITIKVKSVEVGDVVIDDNQNKQTVTSKEFIKEAARWTRMFAVDNEGKPQEHVGWYLNEDSNISPIVYTCEWDELIERHPDLVPKLKEKYGSVFLKNEECIAYSPKAGQIKGVTPAPGTDGEEISIDNSTSVPDQTGTKTTYTKEKINRTFNSILVSELVEDKDFVNTLKRISLPEIVIDDKKHVNSYNINSDKELAFQSHNINLYKTQKEFLLSTRKTIGRGARPEYFESDNYNPKESRHLRRQYNTGYSNWSKTRFTQDGNYGTTPVFGLQQGDFPEKDFSVMVSSDLLIKGKSLGEGEMTNGFRWDLSYNVEYAKKLPNNRVARQIYKDEDVSINLFVDVELSEEKNFDGKAEVDSKGTILKGDTGDNHLLTDLNIVQGLKEILDNFKKEMSGKKQLSMAAKRAQMKQQDVDTADMRLNEEEIKDIINKTINKK